MKNIFILSSLLLLFSTVASAEDLASAQELAQAQGNKITVSVHGMVCEFCARGLEKTLGKKPEVDSIEVSLESGTVTIILGEGKSLSDAEITKTIVGNGISVVSIAR